MEPRYCTFAENSDIRLTTVPGGWELEVAIYRPTYRIGGVKDGALFRISTLAEVNKTLNDLCNLGYRVPEEVIARVRAEYEATRPYHRVWNTLTLAQRKILAQWLDDKTVEGPALDAALESLAGVLRS